MNVLYVGLARTLWLFDFGLFNPGGMSLKGAIEEITRRYQFAKAPKNELDFDEQRSLSFKNGTFTGTRKVPLLLNFNVYSDGFVTDTMSSTEESAEFLNDLARWLKETYGLVVPRDHRENYLSQIDFHSDVSMINLNHRLEAFAANLGASTHKPNCHYEVGSIQFWTEDVGNPGVPAPVKIERKVSAPFSANHFFAQAPLPTKTLIELLAGFEAILKQR
jgi:hypothetical protein